MADMSQAAQECIDDYFKREVGGTTGLLASTQQSLSSLSLALASAQPSGGGIPHQRQSQGGGEGPLASAQPSLSASGAGIPHQHQSQGGGEGPLASGRSREVEVPTEQRAIDLAEVSTVKEFCSRGCGCAMACTLKFSLQHIELTRANAAQLSRGELDMAIMGQIMAFTSCSQATLNSTRHRHKPKQRQKNRMVFYHNGIRCAGRIPFCFSTISESFVWTPSKDDTSPKGWSPGFTGTPAALHLMRWSWRTLGAFSNL